MGALTSAPEIEEAEILNHPQPTATEKSLRGWIVALTLTPVGALFGKYELPKTGMMSVGSTAILKDGQTVTVAHDETFPPKVGEPVIVYTRVVNLVNLDE